jgi:hypothetical protein
MQCSAVALQNNSTGIVIDPTELQYETTDRCEVGNMLTAARTLTSCGHYVGTHKLNDIVNDVLSGVVLEHPQTKHVMSEGCSVQQ